jgi:hypothetical protein
MLLKQVRFTLMGVLLLFLCLCVACATEKGAAQADKPKQPLSAEEKSRQAWEEQVVDNPWMVSSDYFRQKDHSKAINLNEWWEGRKELEAKQEETEERLARLEKAAKREKAEPSEILRFKVALVILPGVYQAAQDWKGALLEAVRSQFTGYSRVLLVGPEEVEEMLIHQGLVVSLENRTEIARALGTYPAARLVVFLEKVALHRDGEGVEGSLDYTIVDGFSGRFISHGEGVESASSGPDGENQVLQELVARIALTLEKMAARYAWLSRVAMVEGKSIYISAGGASGLKPGDILAVYGPGREIIHPVVKVSMGFQPGPYKGKIKVLKLFGSDAAEATLIAGESEIEVNDLAALPDESN